MIDALIDVACFVTVLMSFLYGSRVAWMCGSKCQFSKSVEQRAQMLVRSIPSAAFIYFFGFMVIFDILVDVFATWAVFSVTSSILLSLVVVSMAMPQFKRMPAKSKVMIPVEFNDGTICQLDKRALSASLEAGAIARFKRASGWVEVDTAKLRGSSKNTVFAGVDRREFA